MRDWQMTEVQETGMVDVDGVTLFDLVASLAQLGIRASDVIVDGRITTEPQKKGSAKP